MTTEQRRNAAEHALDAMARSFPATPHEGAPLSGFVPGEFDVQCELCGAWLPEWDEPETWHVYDDDHIAHDACWGAQNEGGPR